MSEAVPEAPGGILTRRAPATAFEVHLEVFSGPFELLLGLISKHKLDITEISLASVTDEFIAHIKAEQASESGWDLSQASEFLLVAATLLDLKAARLLPQLGPEDEDDLALIEARDLLFARLLQYRAFKDIAATFAERMATAGRMSAARGRARAAVRRAAARAGHRHHPRPARDDRRARAHPEDPGYGRAGAPARVHGERARAGRRSSAPGCAGTGCPRSAPWSPTPTAPWSSSPASWPCSSCSATAPSAFEQVEALGELTVRWTGSEDGDEVEVDATSSTRSRPPSADAARRGRPSQQGAPA